MSHQTRIVFRAAIPIALAGGGRFPGRRGLVAILGVAVLLLWAAVPIQATTSTPASLGERATAVRARLAEAQARLSALPADGAGAPPEARAEERAEHARLVNLLANTYENHLDSLNKLKEVHQSRQDLQTEAAAWQGFREKGPYSVDFVDGLWNQVRARDPEIAAARAERVLFEGLQEDLRAAYRNSLQALRQAEERLEAAGPLDRDRARWLRDLQGLRSLTDEARLGALDTQRELRAETLDFRLGQRELLRRKALAASRVSPLTVRDRDGKLAELAGLQRDLDAETGQAIDADRSVRDRLRRAREQPAAERDAKRQELDTLEAEAEASGTLLEALGLLGRALTMQRQAWEQRFLVEQGADAGTRADIAKEIRENSGRLAVWRESFRSALDTARRRVDGQEKLLAGWKPESGDRALAERRRLAHVRQETALRRILAEADALDAVLLNLREAVSFREESAGLAERLGEFSAGLRKLAGDAWDFELLAIEDKIVAEGREIVGTRSVTVGKVVEVLLILGVGLWLTGWIAEHGRRFLTRRLPGRESAALLGLRLFSLFSVAGLVVFALLTVNIPLTVFTFVGGALAIGFGFGAQNILNNFISGLILLVERPIKPGDIVEVEGVRGRVTHIGGRCCQVHRFDGIDMLIPNSSFLEKNVTNWTLSDHRLRFSVTVDAAYGSPIPAAIAALQRAVAEHPKTLADPAPEVYLQEFGESALIFRVDYWVDILIEPNWMRVASDLRIRMEELFDELGIVISFPQRDVHLHGAKPLKVELVGARMPAASGGGQP